jgi:hypothetical protein
MKMLAFGNSKNYNPAFGSNGALEHSFMGIVSKDFGIFEEMCLKKFLFLEK